MDYRKQHSGLIQELDELASVPGVTPQVLNVLKQQTYPDRSPCGHRSGGPQDRRRAAAQSDTGGPVRAGRNAGLHRVPLRMDLRRGGGDRGVPRHHHHHRLFSLFNKEITLTVVAALLTLVGYSMNDTIVTFDRIRENLKIMRREELEPLINKSVNQTLSRTVLTSGLTLLTALALFFSAGRY
jgi:preprotein translocase subunit SecF